MTVLRTLTASKTSPLIIGHRGASALAPENTLAAFARAFDDGAHGIELDVRLSRDGVPVVIHNSSLRHTGRRKGQVARMTSKSLSEVDVGSWFNASHRRLARFQFIRQTIPTLDDVFGLLANHANRELIIYVELKTARGKALNEKLASAVIDVINRRQFEHRVVVISFNLNVVAFTKKLAPSIRTGALFGPRQRATKSVRSMIAATLSCGADEILLHHLIAKRRLLTASRNAKLNTVVWTVDNPIWVIRARENGIHALMSNNPAKML